jgi:hypothetical protein
LLRCIKCGQEYKEEINVNQCPKCAELPNVTNLYSTTIRNFGFKPSPLHKIKENLYLKREDFNEYGRTFKDRKSVFVLNKHKKFVLASSGNQALSLARYEEEHTQPFIIKTPNAHFTMPPTYTKADITLYLSPYVNEKKFEELRNCYKSINFTDRILSTKELTQDEIDRWNITNGMDPIGASAYYSIAMELEPHNFDYIYVPCGSGELYTALSVYFHLLRKKDKPHIVPVQSKLKETDAITTDFVASQPFIDYFAEKYGAWPIVFDDKTETLKRLTEYSEKYDCELSSAVVFEAYEKLNLKGKTCLVVTGAKRN